ncbi:hypothetical protein M1M30_gp138 [Maribacter phage Colly_1]|uniref:Uncharacterized protein n=1 Tax=Maribacter phage Colly_1 TaxID=2745691 RepID=A0A8E4UXU8_9CAUD|nr:hypothetical protein M1M30_gp138 [Maribacter phage Colly_1]QQO97238.1 hypothetical protein Colly1_138 [Maribacter phage Colly_1]
MAHKLKYVSCSCCDHTLIGKRADSLESYVCPACVYTGCGAEYEFEEITLEEYLKKTGLDELVTINSSDNG